MRKKTYRTVEILLEVSRTIGAALDLDTVVDLVLSESRRALRVDHASLFLVDDRSEKLMLVKASGFGGDEIGNIKLLGSWEVVNAEVLRKRKTILINDVTKDPLFKGKNLPFLHERLPIRAFLAVPLMKKEEVVGVLVVSNGHRVSARFDRNDAQLLTALSHHISIALVNARLYESLKRLFMSTVSALIRAVDAKDRYTSGHSERVMRYAVTLGKEMSLEGEKLENLRLSSLLHDIGKIGIHESILQKPTSLGSRERKLINRHPLIGADIVDSIDNAHRIVRGIAEHHERFDGKGYPAGLKGNGISLEGRIIAVADAYDALTTKRSYHTPFTPKEAFFEIRKGMGTCFDPAVVKVFTVAFSKYPYIWTV